MSDNGKIGVFLCECGQRIAPLVDLASLQKMAAQEPGVGHASVEVFPCQKPGLQAVKQTIGEKGLDRILLAGCESRVMLKKFERELDEAGLAEGQIDMVNLRGHVAAVHDLDPQAMAAKGGALIKAALGGLRSLEVTPAVQVTIDKPVLLVGGGIATYPAAQELVRRGVKCIIAVQTDDYWDELRMLHEHYPGERHYYDRLEKIMQEVEGSPLVRRVTVGEFTSLLGRTGDYAAAFSQGDEGPPLIFEAGAVIACLDGQMLNQGSDFGHDGKTVICHTEVEELIWTKGVPSGKIVFWINDQEAKHPEFSYLSARSAWSIARYMCEHSNDTQATILYRDNSSIPLSAGERKLGRALGIGWVPYDPGMRPTVQAGFITYCDPQDHIEYEMPWDKLILSPRRSTGLEVERIADVLGLEHRSGAFLEQHRTRVRPEMQGREESFLAGSARYPCDLHETLRQGRRAAVGVAKLVEKSRQGQLYAPRMVCVVDQNKCVGCGLCKELCDCGGIEPVEGLGGNIPRRVDPMVCTGGATCAAACPYGALSTQNNTTEQREARVAALAQAIGDTDVIAFGCAWGGQAAADHAGIKGLKYDPGLYMLSVGCIGQLDPSVLARAFMEGANGLLLVGCPPEECHHSYGIDHSWSRVNMLKKLLALSGLDRRRVALAHADLNQPEEFVATANNFVSLIRELGPIERTPQVSERLRGIYTTANNARTRWVLGATLRRPWEDVYPSNQRNALAFDHDFISILREEFTQSRVANLLGSEQRPFARSELNQALAVDDELLSEVLREMVAEGAVSRVHKEGIAHYAIS